jgi:hypothetical protein
MRQKFYYLALCAIIETSLAKGLVKLKLLVEPHHIVGAA